ncbi:hypothetical protein RI367_007289 [Sorochytrium milnesiophthora]
MSSTAPEVQRLYPGSPLDVVVNATYPGDLTDFMILYHISSRNNLTIVARMHDVPSLDFLWVTQGVPENKTITIDSALGYSGSMHDLLADGIRFIITPTTGNIQIGLNALQNPENLTSISPSETFIHQPDDVSNSYVRFTMRTYKTNYIPVSGHFRLQSPGDSFKQPAFGFRLGYNRDIYDDGHAAFIEHTVPPRCYVRS